MKNILKLFVGLIIFLFWAQTFAAGSIAPHYIFEADWMRPLWFMDINGDSLYYSESTFYENVKNQRIDLKKHDYIKIITTDDAINFKWNYFSWKIIKKQCIGEWNWFTHEYTIEFTKDWKNYEWCANKLKETKSIFNAFWTEPFWTIDIEWDNLYYGGQEINENNKIDYSLIARENMRVKFSKENSILKFSWKQIVWKILEKECEDDAKWDTHKYTIEFIKNWWDYKWCGDWDIWRLDKFIEVIDEELPPIWWDRDAHGCLLWAGYNWYPVKQECVRIFEVNLDSENYQKYLKTLDKAWAKWQKKIYDIMQKYKKIIAKLSQEKQKNINKKVITKIDTILKNKENTLLELLKFEIMQLD